MSDAREEPAERYAYAGLDRVIHERARLGLLTSLAAHLHGLTFNELKHLCALTDGNLSRHLQVLQHEGIVEIHRDESHPRPQSRCVLTAAGRDRFVAYLAALEQVIADAAEATRRPLPASRGSR
jgi:DNA-binding HxlR family transcriptional regulator